MTKYFVISDIHGCFDDMIKALNEAKFDDRDPYHKLIVLGDMFDRGEQSLEVYKYIKGLYDEGKAQVVMGNHERMFIDYLKGSTRPWNYFQNGERTTFDSFQERTLAWESYCLIDKDIQDDYDTLFKVYMKDATKEIKKNYPELLPWLESLPYYIETKTHILTHGAIDTTCDNWKEPEYELYNKKGWEALMWNDGTFINWLNLVEKTIVVGHFDTGHLRYWNPQYGDKDDHSILETEDGKVFIDACTIATHQVNVYTFEE